VEVVVEERRGKGEGRGVRWQLRICKFGLLHNIEVIGEIEEVDMARKSSFLHEKYCLFPKFDCGIS